jgi:hypothetical protein
MPGDFHGDGLHSLAKTRKQAVEICGDLMRAYSMCSYERWRSALRQREQVVLPNTIGIGLDELVAGRAGAHADPGGGVKRIGSMVWRSMNSSFGALAYFDKSKLYLIWRVVNP